jgi:hypothetical protein
MCGRKHREPRGDPHREIGPESRLEPPVVVERALHLVVWEADPQRQLLTFCYAIGNTFLDSRQRFVNGHATPDAAQARVTPANQEFAMHIIRFFPIGNADCCVIELENGRRILFDFADMRDPNDSSDKRCDLEKELRDALGDDKEIDVVAFTHLDTDHCKRAKEVFELGHAEAYKGGNRIKIKTLWVPAAAVLEKGVKGQGRTLRAEARHRFIEGKGIRVFSRPEKLDQFLRDRDIDPAKRRNMISDAGTLCPEFNLEADGVEFFVHSPFAEHVDDEVVVRNDSALFMQATFEAGGRSTRLILSADLAHEVIDDIVRVTRHYGNDHRLKWDVNNVPHHSSYRSLAAEKGDGATEPGERLKWLYEDQGQRNGLLVSTSDPIPTGATDQPPHREAAAYYEKVAKRLDGSFVVTMEHPVTSGPKSLVIEIGGSGHTIRKATGGAAAVIHSAAPRAG